MEGRVARRARPVPQRSGRFVDVSAGSGADSRCGVAAASPPTSTATANRSVRHDSTARLLWNQGDGTFNEGAGRAWTRWAGSRAAVGDVDGDGWPDLFVAGYADLNGEVPAGPGFPNTYLGVRDLLFLSNGRSDGRVTSARSGVSRARGRRVRVRARRGLLRPRPRRRPRPVRRQRHQAEPAVRQRALAGRGGRRSRRARLPVRGARGPGGRRRSQRRHGRRRRRLRRGRPARPVRHQRARPGARRLPSRPRPPIRRSSTSRRVRPRPPGSFGLGRPFADLDLDTDLDLLLRTGPPVTDLAAEPSWSRAAEPRRSIRGREDMIGLDEVGPRARQRRRRLRQRRRRRRRGDSSAAGSCCSRTAARGGTGSRSRSTASTRARVTAVLDDGRTLGGSSGRGSYLSSEDPRCTSGSATREVARSSCAGRAVRRPASTTSPPNGRSRCGA